MLLPDLTDVHRLLCSVRVGMVRGRPQPMWMHGEIRGIVPSLQIPEDLLLYNNVHAKVSARIRHDDEAKKLLLHTQLTINQLTALFQ